MHIAIELAAKLNLFGCSQCDGSASVPRSVEWSYSESSDTCDDVPPIPVPKTKPFNTTCSQLMPHM